MGHVIPPPPCSGFARRNRDLIVGCVPASLVIAYIVAGVFTHAFFWWRHPMAKGTLVETGEQRAIASFAAGALWPLYWTAKFAFDWTKPSEDVEVSNG